MLRSGFCNALIPTYHPPVIHSSLRGCQIIFFINCIFDVHVFIFHKCRLHYLILVEKLKGWDGFYAGDWWLHISCSFEAHGISKFSRCFSRDQLESLQRILDDAVEDIINVSPCRIRIHLPAEDDIFVVQGELSVSKAYKVCYISIWKQLEVIGI